MHEGSTQRESIETQGTCKHTEKLKPWTFLL